MRDGWVGNTKLQERLQRADPDASVILEALVVENEDTKVTKEDFDAADSVVGITTLEDGGAKITGSFATLAEQATKVDSITTDLDNTEPFRVVELRFDGTHQGKEIRRVTCRLDPDAAGSGVSVSQWRMQLLTPNTIKVLDGGTFLDLRPLGETVIVEHGGGTSPSDVVFDLRSTNSTPVLIPHGGTKLPLDDGDAQYPTEPGQARVYVIIWAVTGQGNAASSVAWLGDSGNNTASGTGWSADHRNLNLVNRDKEAARGGSFEDTGQGTGIQHFKVETGSYSAKTITWSGAGNRIDLGVSPTEDLEVRFGGIEFEGSTMTPELQDPTSAGWVEVADGDIIGEDNTATGGNDLSSLAVRQTYDARVTLTPGGGGISTPIVRRIGVEERSREDLQGIAELVSWSRAVDPVDLHADLGPATIRIIKDGITDYRDYFTELFSQHHIGQIEFRAWVGSPDLDRKYWLHLEDFLVNDTSSFRAHGTVKCVSPMVLLRGLIPAYDTINDEREPKEYTDQKLSTVYADLIDTQLALPSRRRGAGVIDYQIDSNADGTKDADAVVTKRIEEADGKAEAEAVAYLAGGSLISSQGRIKYAHLHQDLPNDPSPHVVDWIPMGETGVREISPGWSERVDEFFVPWGWERETDRSRGSYLGEVRSFHSSAITKLGSGQVRDGEPPRLDDRIARWIPQSGTGGGGEAVGGLAEHIASRQTTSLGTGMITFDVVSTVARPHLERGDVIAVETDRMVARDPNLDRPLYGPLWLIGPVVRIQDPLGKRLTVWMRSYSDILPGTTRIGRVNYETPEVQLNTNWWKPIQARSAVWPGETDPDAHPSAPTTLPGYALKLDLHVSPEVRSLSIRVIGELDDGTPFDYTYEQDINLGEDLQHIVQNADDGTVINPDGTRKSGGAVSGRRNFPDVTDHEIRITPYTQVDGSLGNGKAGRTITEVFDKPSEEAGSTIVEENDTGVFSTGERIKIARSLRVGSTAVSGGEPLVGIARDTSMYLDAGDGSLATQAIKNAITDAKDEGGGMVFLARGTRLIKHDVILDRSVTLVGEGSKHTVLKGDTTAEDSGTASSGGASTLSDSSKAWNSDSGTASSGGADTLTDTSKSFTVDEWDSAWVKITGGTGEGQERFISSNTSDTLTVERDWDTQPDATSTYEIYEFGGHWVEITGGTGNAPGGANTQLRRIESHTATQLTTEVPWSTQPDATSTYKIYRPARVLVKGTGDWTHEISNILFEYVEIVYAPDAADFCNGSRLLNCEIKNANHGVQYVQNTWASQLAHCDINSCTIGIHAPGGLGNPQFFGHSLVHDCHWGVFIDGAEVDGTSAYFDTTNVEQNLHTNYRFRGASDGAIYLMGHYTVPHQNPPPATEYFIDVEDNVQVFLSDFWAFPSGSSLTALFRIGTDAQVRVLSGRVQWDDNTLVELAGGELIWHEENIRTNKTLIGPNNSVPTTASSTSGRISYSGSGDAFSLPLRYRPIAARLNDDFSLPTNGTSLQIEGILGFDKATRIYEFDLEVVSFTDDVTFRVYLNPGGTDIVNLDLTADGVGGGHFKIVYEPDSEIVVSGVYNGTWHRGSNADGRTQTADRFIAFEAVSTNATKPEIEIYNLNTNVY